MAELFRLGVSSEAKGKIINQIDQKRFLRFDEEDRAVMYSFAVCLCAHNDIPPKKATCESFVMDKSVKEGTMALLILAYLLTVKNIGKNIDVVGVNQRKDLVAEHLNPMANAGFSIMKGMMARPDDVIISKFIKEMDEMYSRAVELSPESALPAVKPFSA